MKKKIIISSLLIGSSISILPLNFIFNKSSFITNKIENENVNEEKQISNIAKSKTKDGYVDALYDKDYSALFINNFTSPVISPNPEIPGFLGSWDNNTLGRFPSTIGWTTHNLYLSWSANLMDHPSLEGQVPNGFTPGLVTALHSDSKYSSDKKNQVFAIVANTANLSAREYWILRYNTLDGSPIKDDNAKMPKMPKSPLPQMTAENGNGSAFALTNDTINNRYIAYYPGKLGDFKNEIFGFRLNSNNKIEWLENKDHFQGHSSWRNNPDLSDDNIILGLAPFNTRRTTIDTKASLSLLVGTSADVRNYNFKYINLQDDLAVNSNFEGRAVIGRSSGVFNTAKGNITVPKSFLPLEAIQRNINPNLQLFTFRNEEFQDTFKVQMVVPIFRNNEWIYMYLSSIFDNEKNTYHISWKGDGSLSQGSFFSSNSFGNSPMPPNIAYDENNPNEILITSQANATDSRRFSGTRFKFDTIPNNGPWDPSSFIVNSLFNTSGNDLWRAKQIMIKNPYVRNNYIWSIPNGLTEKYVVNESGQKILWSKITSGGIKHESFQKTASALGWLKGQSNSKIPSDITPEELETIGSSSSNFFKIPNVDYLNGITAEKPKIKLFGEPLRDDRNGIIQGVFTLSQNFRILNESYLFESKIPFKVTGLNIKNDTPTTINQNNLILGNLPSDLTSDNIPDFIDVIAAPDNATINNWQVSEQDNSAGTAKISVDVQPHYGDDGKLSTSLKKITTNVSGLRKLSGTTAIKSSETDPNLSVWEVNSSNASRFVEIKDLIPGSSSDAIKFEPKNQKPLTGELTIDVSIAPGAYYDPNNKGLPSNSSDPQLQLSVQVEGFKRIPDTGTLVIPGNGPYPGVWPGFINENNIMDFITIENQVPESEIKFSNFKVSEPTDLPLGGSLKFDITFDKEYNKDGTINTDAIPKTYEIKGFEGSITPKETRIASTGNTDLFSNTLAPEIDENNINQFVVLVNLPPNVTPKYEFKNQKNTGQPNTGFQDIVVTVPKYYNSAGLLVEKQETFTGTIKGLKTISAATSVTTLSGDRNMLPEFVSEVGLEKYLLINNGSPIPQKESSIQVIPNTLVSNNVAGTISFEYNLINAITDFGFINESNPIPVTISGFERGTITGVEQIGDFKDKKASEFDLNIDNFFNHAKFIGYSIPLKTDDEGNVTGTAINKIEKISFNDSLGVATFKIQIEGGAINQEGKFTSSPLDITFSFDGFEIVAIQDNTIPIIAGAVAGGVVLIILIVVAIVIFNNKKNKKILNEKRKPTAPGAPPINSGVTKSASSPQTPSAPMQQPPRGPTSPMGPPQSSSGAARPLPPIPPKK